LAPGPAEKKKKRNAFWKGGLVDSQAPTKILPGPSGGRNRRCPAGGRKRRGYIKPWPNKLCVATCGKEKKKMFDWAEVWGREKKKKGKGGPF